MAETININGLTADEVYQTIKSAGVSEVDAKLLVSNWIFQNYLTLHRTFSYVTEFSADKPECVPAAFQRTFVHRDWVDGEDLVQATNSANDDGFNTRFHHIEADLDALGKQLATLVGCLADMRHSLRQLLDEIAAELNRIDSDLGALKGPPVWRPPVVGVIGGLQTAGGASQLTDVRFATQAVAGQQPPGSWADPMLHYLGSTIYQDKAVSLFNTSQGVMIMPAVDVSTPSMVDTRVGTAGAVWRATVDNADLKAATQGAVSKPDLVSRFGEVTLANGQTLKQALAVLPADAHYDSVQAMMTDLCARTAGALQSTTGLTKQLAATLNAPADATTLSSVDISGLRELAPAAAADLRKAGIGTIGQLATTPAPSLNKVLQAAGVSPAEVAAIQGTAQTLANMTVD
jgi:hypothetical protein